MHTTICTISARVFQFTPSRGGRPHRMCFRQHHTRFNSRPRAEGDCKHFVHILLFVSFNSRPRAEGDAILLYLLFQCQVSIHALARRATLRFCMMFPGCKFQFTPSRGGRHNGIIIQACSRTVSIHALARRATSGCPFRLRLFWFQFTPSRGGRQRLPQRLLLSARFNSRPRAEGDTCVNSVFLVM